MRAFCRKLGSGSEFECVAGIGTIEYRGLSGVEMRFEFSPNPAKENI
jgi:hypothetical protein